MEASLPPALARTIGSIESGSDTENWKRALEPTPIAVMSSPSRLPALGLNRMLSELPMIEGARKSTMMLVDSDDSLPAPSRARTTTGSVDSLPAGMMAPTVKSQLFEPSVPAGQAAADPPTVNPALS